MPTCSVCSHANRKEIDLALVRGTSLRDIAGQFGVSRSAVDRHKKNCLADQIERAEKIVRARKPAPPPPVEPHAVKIVEAQDEAALDVMTEVRRLFSRMNKLLAACDEWLTDPNDPTRYDLGPRAHELIVTYEDVDDSGERPIVIRRKASLSELLDRAKGSETARTYTMVESKSADPRDLIVKTSRQLKGQIELLARLLGELSESPTVNVVLSPEWVKVRAAITEALRTHPEAQAAVVTKLRAIGAAHAA